MPKASVNGVDLYWEETGQGAPLVWVHEYGGDLRSWELQVRYFSRRYRVVTYNHRGYPPSTVPQAARDYSQALLVEDLHQLLTHLGLGPVHLGGCSMGANVARDFAIAHPKMTRSLILVGAGAGAVNREQFLQAQEATAAELEQEGIAARVRTFEGLPTRASFKAKDPQGFAEFLRQAGEHDALACAHLAREVIAKRKTIFELEAELKALSRPDADHGRRPRRPVCRALAGDARLDAARRAGPLPGLRPYAESRRAGPLQPPRRRVPRRSRGRAMGRVVQLSARGHRFDDVYVGRINLGPPGRPETPRHTHPEDGYPASRTQPWLGTRRHGGPLPSGPTRGKASRHRVPARRVGVAVRGTGDMSP